MYVSYIQYVFILMYCIFSKQAQGVLLDNLDQPITTFLIFYHISTILWSSLFPHCDGLDLRCWALNRCKGLHTNDWGGVRVIATH